MAGDSFVRVKDGLSSAITPADTLQHGGRLLEESSFPKPKARKADRDLLAAKRRCVSSACIACRKRKSKCDGNLPSCAACLSVYGTECVYDPNSDHRRKGVYKQDAGGFKTRNTTLQILIQGILNYPENEVYGLVKRIRTCENLEEVAEEIHARDAALQDDSGDSDFGSVDIVTSPSAKIERELAGKMGELRLENGSLRFLGGTSNLLYLDSDPSLPSDRSVRPLSEARRKDFVTSWTSVTTDKELVIHLLNMYFTWHYPYFATLSKSLFFRDFFRGRPEDGAPQLEYCTSLLVNAMLCVGCHFTSWAASRTDAQDPSTAGDHFFKEAKRLVVDNDELESPRLATVQALALMSVREAGCGREAKGWVYSGMSFRMACDLGVNLGLTGGSGTSSLDEQEIDARRITFWGCFLFDKCWSIYLGRIPQLVMSNITTPKFEVFPWEDAESWSPWTDVGSDKTREQPSRTRAIALQISSLCEISSDLLLAFYRPAPQDKPLTKPAEVKRLSDFHTRLEGWRKALPREMEPHEGQLPNVLLMHMFFHLLFIHLFQPFLKYYQANSPLPPQVSPRKMCTQAAKSISKLLRIYKKTYGLKQVCNIAVYMAHSACTIHLLNLPDKDARRDITHGVRHLEEIAESWLCASRTLATLGIQARRWEIELPKDTATILHRWEAQYRNSHSFPMQADHPSNTEGAERLASTKSEVPPFSNSQIADSLLQGPPLATATINAQPVGQRDPAFQKAGNFGLPSSVSSQQQALSLLQTPQHAQPMLDISGSSLPAANSSAFVQAKRSRRPSYSSLFPGLDALFEDGKEWWLRDQPAIFNNRNTRSDPPTAIANGSDVNAVIGGLSAASDVSNITTASPTDGQGHAHSSIIYDVRQAGTNDSMDAMDSWDFGVPDVRDIFEHEEQVEY